MMVITRLEKTLHILITGIEGYIGSRLAPYLRNLGHQVSGIDTQFYQAGREYLKNYPLNSIVKKDLRNITFEDLKGIDICVHLAELSNDALGQLNQKTAYSINHQGSVRFASLCKQVGISRFIYISSCSLYGKGKQGLVSELSPVNPLTVYAKCKQLVENHLLEIASELFSPTILRLATLYGPSPNIRFDIVLNNLAGMAWTQKKIVLNSDGSPWRPMIHINDVCKAISCVISSPTSQMHNKIYNVGETKENYRVRDIAQIISDVFPNTSLIVGNKSMDERSYQVSFDKIKKEIPSFHCEYNLIHGAEHLYKFFQKNNLGKDHFEFSAFHRVKHIQYLLDTKQIDNNYYWINK